MEQEFDGAIIGVPMGGAKGAVAPPFITRLFLQN